jgi:hypothetical protein
MFCYFIISKSWNVCGEQAAAKLGEGLSKLINISNLTLNLRLLNKSNLHETFKKNYYRK